MEFHEARKALKANYGHQVEELGYKMATGHRIGVEELVAILRPLPGSEDPIPKDLLQRITEEVLPSEYEGFTLEVIYIAIPKTQGL